MVSWSNTNGVHAERDAGTSGRRSQRGQLPDTSEEGERNGGRFVTLAQDGEWEELELLLDAVSSETFLSEMEYHVGDEEDLNMLHVAAASIDCPICVFKKIVNLIKRYGDNDPTRPSILTQTNALQQTALHLAVINNPECNHAVEYLVRPYRVSVGLRDSLQLRPIDHLTQKIIMKEEAMRYSNVDNMDKMWETVHVLVCLSALGTLEQQPLVHACLRCPGEVPFALTERALRQFEYQLFTSDNNGDIPLHIIARVPPESDDGLLERVLSVFPEATKHFNNYQQLPLSVAMQGGRGWNSGILILLCAYPAALEEIHLEPGLYPLLFELLSQKHDTLYCILQAHPEIFMNSGRITGKSEY